MLDQVAAASGSPIATGNNGYASLHVRYVFNTGIERRHMNDVSRMLHDGLLVDATFTIAGQQALAFADGECAMSIDSTGAWAGIKQAGLVDADVSMMPVYAGRPLALERETVDPALSRLRSIPRHKQSHFAAHCWRSLSSDDCKRKESIPVGFMAVSAAARLASADAPASPC